MHVFYVEGFVAEHLGECVADDTWMFTAATVQNGPAGMRSRFELAMAGKDFALYTRETLRPRRTLALT